MRIQAVIFVVVLLLSLGSDCYIWLVLKRRFRQSWPRKVELWSAVALYAMVAVALLLPRNSGSDATLVAVMWMLFAFASVLIGKLVFVVFDLLASLPVLWRGKRRRGLTYAAIALGVIVTGSMWWGAVVGRYRLQVREVTVKVPNLPPSLAGLRVAQISDLHVGTFISDTTFVGRIASEIDRLHPDAVVFTGDIVNRRSDEILPFVGTLSRIQAPMGVYAILGNHDYGDYSSWPSDADKRANMSLLFAKYREMEWHLLRNQTAWMVRGTDSLAVIGVENVGDRPFPVYGDLKRSYRTLSDSLPKILLTHNPAHWQQEIADNDDINIALTLSGHTHAMQIELLGLSPAVFRYPTWGGMYIDPSGRHPLYVNIGAGTVGFPMRIGATPEITLLTLQPE